MVVVRCTIVVIMLQAYFTIGGRVHVDVMYARVCRVRFDCPDLFTG